MHKCFNWAKALLGSLILEEDEKKRRANVC